MHGPNKKPKTASLIALLDRLKAAAKEAAAAPDTAHHQWDLLIHVMLLDNAVADIIEIASDDAAGPLETALLSTFMIGSLASKELQAEVAKRLQKQTAHATQRRQDEAAVVGRLVRQWRAEGDSVEKIKKKLAAMDIKREKSTIYDHLKQPDDDSQK
jgi:hypothetical protein